MAVASNHTPSLSVNVYLGRRCASRDGCAPLDVLSLTTYGISGPLYGGCGALFNDW